MNFLFLLTFLFNKTPERITATTTTTVNNGRQLITFLFNDNSYGSETRGAAALNLLLRLRLQLDAFSLLLLFGGSCCSACLGIYI
jgi:hypothetical protein